MSRPAALAAWLQGLLERHLGVAGVAGIALLVACAAFSAAGLRPALAERAALRAELERAASGGAAAQPGRFAEEALAGFYGMLGGRDEAAAALRSVFDAAAVEGLAVELGEYRLAPQPGSKLLRYQIVLPVKGSYGAVRRFVARALNDVPGLALEGLDLRRESVSASAVEARVQLSLYLAAG